VRVTSEGASNGLVLLERSAGETPAPLVVGDRVAPVRHGDGRASAVQGSLS
jgi:hypothetical protein